MFVVKDMLHPRIWRIETINPNMTRELTLREIDTNETYRATISELRPATEEDIKARLERGNPVQNAQDTLEALWVYFKGVTSVYSHTLKMRHRIDMYLYLKSKGMTPLVTINDEVEVIDIPDDDDDTGPDIQGFLNWSFANLRDPWR